MLVVGGAPSSRLDQVRRDADEALRYVRGVWDGPWADRVVVEVPADGAGFRAASGRAGGEAAVAVLPWKAGGAGAPGPSSDGIGGGAPPPGCPSGGCPSGALPDGGTGSGTSSGTGGGISSGTGSGVGSGTGHGAGGGSGDDGPGAGRVIVDPEVYDRLSAEGRQVVLRHEFTHLASADVTGAGTPTWLVEGLAETVGHAGVRLAVARAATELAAEVRAGRLPDALPDDAAFSATDGSVPVRYQQAWLACRLIADRAGLDGLVRFYRQAGTGAGDPQARLADALRAVLGVTEADFVAQWRSYMDVQLRP
ncbi:hypothetical protein [Frankia sp. CiP1_Cm_nod2]|uniref:hypothetical protein n=1 Tax=Frankia sp. CiP1_Cm_nod2 TaxID=2897161 RepID=UPI002024E225